MQNCSISIANALKTLQSSAKPSICHLANINNFYRDNVYCFENLPVCACVFFYFCAVNWKYLCPRWNKLEKIAYGHHNNITWATQCFKTPRFGSLFNSWVFLRETQWWLISKICLTISVYVTGLTPSKAHPYYGCQWRGNLYHQRVRYNAIRTLQHKLVLVIRRGSLRQHAFSVWEIT